MAISEEEGRRWRTALRVHNRGNGGPLLDQLEQMDHAQFIALCHALLQADDLQIRRVVLAKLGQHGDRDDEVAQQVIRELLKLPELQDVALYALGNVGTPGSFAILLQFASAGSPAGLRAASKQARTEEERQLVMHLARSSILSNNLQLRVASTEVLLTHSTPELEERVLIEAAEVYTDDFVVDVLSQASNRVVPTLRALLAKYPPASAEWKDLHSAISTIEQQANFS